MTTGDHYASYADIQAILMNAGIGTSGNTLFSDTAIELALDITMAKIHLMLDITAKNTDTVFAPILEGIQIDLVAQMIIRARMFQTMNLADAGTLSSLAPGIQFTDEHLADLEMIKNKLAGV